MNSRGFLQDCSDLEGLDERMKKETISAYIGFDATADSLHVGSLIQIMMLRWLQKTGHRPIALMGGGTTKIGDPSGKDQSRQLLTSDEIQQNIIGIRQVFDKYIKFGESSSDAIQPNNAEWLENLNYVEFLRSYGRHFTINRMLSFDSVRLRLEREQPLTFLEFNYMLLQAYDFMELNKRFGCQLQMGGSDQWGNIVNGIDLTRRINKSEVYGLTTPLLTKADGSKMGKSADGAIWLNEDKLEAYNFWQFWRNTMDEDVVKFLKLFTELPLDECERLGKLKGSEINTAKQILATEVTTLAHGRDRAKNAEETSKTVFADGSSAIGLPTEYFSESELINGVTGVQLFTKSGLSSSGKDAKRLIAEGGARIDGIVLNDTSKLFYTDDIINGLKLSAGKKRHALIKIKK
tara:strand:+ start:502 stop:1719 length:1218 start_codon:yes stop_codon:yes gene_type:complete